MATNRREDVERTMRDADATNGEPGALDREPDDGALPSDTDVQAERQPGHEGGRADDDR